MARHVLDRDATHGRANQSKILLPVPSSLMQDSPSLVHGTESDLFVLIVDMTQELCSSEIQNMSTICKCEIRASI
jgi:hypothetical protein